MLVNIKSYSAIQQAVPVAFSNLVCVCVCEHPEQCVNMDADTE